MKLLVAIIQDEDYGFLIDDLTESGFRVTKLSSTGGFLKNGNSTLLIGVNDDKVEECLSIIEKNCKKRTVPTNHINIPFTEGSDMPYPIEVKVGGAVVFIVDVEREINF